MKYNLQTFKQKFLFDITFVSDYIFTAKINYKSTKKGAANLSVISELTKEYFNFASKSQYKIIKSYTKGKFHQFRYFENVLLLDLLKFEYKIEKFFAPLI